MAYTKYSLTPANNTAAPPDGAPEGMLPSAVNDTMRDMMAQIRDCGDGIRDGTYTMTAPKITGGTITGAAFTGNTFTSPVISGGSINNTPIGATTANTGAFTALGATGNTNLDGGTFVFNDSGADKDFRIEGDTDANLFFTDASADRIGIGTSSPATKAEISGTAAASNLALRITNTATDGYSTLQLGGSGDGGVFRNGSAQSGYAGASSLNLITVGSHAIGLATGNTIRAIIPAAGGVQAVTTISVGNATPSASGAGITFPATQSASSDANTLDDYEEGTWTPTLTGWSSITYNAQNGTYVKIGRQVTCWFDIRVTAGTNSIAAVQVTGLPFTVGQSTNNGGGMTTYADLPVDNLTYYPAYPGFTTTSINFYNFATGATTTSNGNISGTKYLQGCVIYEV